MKEQTRAGTVLELLSRACFEIADNTYTWCGEVQYYTLSHVASPARLEWEKAGESLKSDLARKMNEHVRKIFEDGGLRVDLFYKDSPCFYCEPKTHVHASMALGISRQCEQYLKENEGSIPRDVSNALMNQSLQLQEVASGVLNYCYTCPSQALLSNRKISMLEYFTMEALYKTMKKFRDFREIGIMNSSLARFLLGEDKEKSFNYNLDEPWFNKECAEISSTLGEIREFSGRSPLVISSLDYLTQQLDCYKEIIKNVFEARRKILVLESTPFQKR